jgi:tyrosine decarboxylase / aspartate 1-decarboxylase
MTAGEFDMPASHLDAPVVPRCPFPEAGVDEDKVVAEVEQRYAQNRYPIDRNFSITYSGIPSAVSQRIDAMSAGRYFVEWGADTESGTMSMEREAVAMMGSLLGNPAAQGFITTGGTESNIAAMRLARNSGKQDEPEVVGPTTMHFSFRLAAELMGIKLVEVDVDKETYLPRLDDIERAITPRTVGIVCSAPMGLFGTMDPVEELSELAWAKGLYLHVDAAFGGFILPFLPALGVPVAPFDMSLRGVSSISTDGHKLGMMPVATGFFLTSDTGIFETVPTERTLIHTTSSTKPGGRAASAWATLRALGRSGYVDSTRHLLRLRETITSGVTAVPGIRLVVPPLVGLVGITSDSVDMAAVHTWLDAHGWGQSYGELRGTRFIRLSIHPSRTLESAAGFVEAFRQAVEAKELS